MLIPRDSSKGAIDCCSDETNEDLGAEFGGGGVYGFGASEVQLDGMGRRCGVTAESNVLGYQMRLDYYATTPGAIEAYRREADTMRDDELKDIDSSDRELFTSIGDRQELRMTTGTMNGQPFMETYDVLFQRRNLVARVELQYWGTIDSSSKPPVASSAGGGPLTPLLQYAAQLDQNIQAAAAQQQGG